MKNRMNSKMAVLGVLIFFMACGDPDKKTETVPTEYDACTSKRCGDTCSTCAPDDDECVETTVEKACNASGECVAAAEDLCESAFDDCADKVCGDNCSVCDPADVTCVSSGATSFCNADGECVAGFDRAALCEDSFNDCEDKSCGDPCSICDPDDTDCVGLGAPTYCNSEGVCAAGSPQTLCGDLCEDVTCPGNPAMCVETVLYFSTPSVECNPTSGSCDYPPVQAPMDCADDGKVCENGSCVESELCRDVECPGEPPACIGNLAYSGSPEGVCDPETGECLQTPGAPPQDCEAQGLICEDGQCVEPPPYEPCGGKMCGDTCTLCDPNDSDCVETGVVKYCNPDGDCRAAMVDCG